MTSQVVYPVGPPPAWAEFGPLQIVEGVVCRELLGDFSHLHEVDRPPRYYADVPFVPQPISPVADRGADRAPIPMTKAGQHIEALKGLHTGKVAILFNGPSLARHNLHDIKVPIIGMNRTFQGFPGYDGPQPDYLCVVDLAWLNEPKVQEHPKLVNGSADYRALGYRVMRHWRMKPFSFDIGRDGFVPPVPCTTGFLALQLAVYLGFTELYCLGLDLGGPHFDGTPSSIHFNLARGYHRKQAPVLAERGISLFLCGSPDSTLGDTYEHRPFSEVA